MEIPGCHSSINIINYKASRGNNKGKPYLACLNFFGSRGWMRSFINNIHQKAEL